MPKTNFEYSIIPANEKKHGKGVSILSLAKEDFESFDSSTLGLGDISQQGQYIQALAAFYDLEGFTSFSNQIDSHLVIPEFLRRFIDWLFTSLGEEIKEGEQGDRVTLWARLPFFTKFLGDGVLLLWDTGGHEYPLIVNVIRSLHQISDNYKTKFLPEVKKQVSNPPSRLRCGVARGQIISIGDGHDYVGSCVNLASRLQKLSQLTFAISRRGIDLSQVQARFPTWKNFVLKKVTLRGMGNDELVYVDQREFRRLPIDERKIFSNP